MHLAYYTMVALFTVAICCIAPANGQAEERDRDVTELIAQLAVGDSIDREEVAEALAAFDDERITPALTERLKHEEVFHVRMAIHRWLASHGEKASVRKLIDSLNRPGHLGAVHLNRVTGMGYDWNIDRWEKWYKETSEQEYRENAKRRLIPKRIIDEWRRFASIHKAQYFEGRIRDGREPLSDEQRRLLSVMPNAKAWQLFESAITALQKEGDRQKSAKLFHKVATQYAGTYYADQSKELADLLDEMTEEDRIWKEPADLSKLTAKQRVDYHVYHLR